MLAGAANAKAQLKPVRGSSSARGQSRCPRAWSSCLPETRPDPVLEPRLFRLVFALIPCFCSSGPRARRLHLARTHHGGQAGDVLDRILHLLLRHLHQGAVLILGGQQLRSVLGDPRVQLQLITQPVRDDCLFFVTPTTQAWQTHLLAQATAPVPF